jgi:hypothetical protein
MGFPRFARLEAANGEDLEMEQTTGNRIGAAIGVGIDAIVDGVKKIGYDLQLDQLAEAAVDGAEAAGDHVMDGWAAWHETQPVTSTAVTGAAALTVVLAAAAGKRGLMLALTGSAIGGALLLPIFLVELTQTAEALRNRADGTV